LNNFSYKCAKLTCDTPFESPEYQLCALKILKASESLLRVNIRFWVYRVPSEFEVSKSLVTLKFHGYHESLMGYRRVCGGFRRMPKPPQISAVIHQISHGNHAIFKVNRDLRPQISLGILVPQILMCYQQTLRPSNLREITQQAVSNKILALLMRKRIL